MKICSLALHPTERKPLSRCICLAALLLCSLPLHAGNAAPPVEQVESAAARGYRALTEKSYLPSEFDQEIFDQIWRTWPEPLRSQAAKSSLAQRRRLAFQRYGLTPRPNDNSGKPLQYVVDAKGNWALNCFACHGGKVAGQVIAGLPNTHYAMQTFMEEIRASKLLLGKPLAVRDLSASLFPMGSTNGTTNAVMFGVALAASRDAELNFQPFRRRAKLVNHDMDAPPWWHFRKRPRIYIDGMAERGHRALMQFLMVRENGPDNFHQWESDFKDIYAYLMSLESPEYPFAIDRPLATRGKSLFNQHCASCHGTYGPKPHYPNVMVPITDIGTDPVRWEALTEDYRRWYQASWFTHHGEKKVTFKPTGYIPPPLDGIWASAPYLHNGSVPTLWGVLNPDQRPAIWTRSENGYDRQQVGLEFKKHRQLPDHFDDRWKRRQFFDTGQPGKSAAGHRFPEVLTTDQKQAVLEYLKTL